MFNSNALMVSEQGLFPIDSMTKSSGCRTIKVITAEELLEQTFPPRELMMQPFLPVQGLVMVYAIRGLGKTWLTLGIAHAVATGIEFLKWKVPVARRVLLIDGEMQASVLQERLNQIIGNHAKNAPLKNLKIITSDMQPLGMPDLSTSEGQELIADAVEEADLIIIDNLSTLCRSGRENEAESWTPVQEWALDLRRRGKSVLFVHHANKNGGQRGSIRKEDVLDTVIALQKPRDYDPANGARFEVHFEKQRGFHGEDAEPFEVHLKMDHADHARWTWEPLVDARLERVIQLHETGMSHRQIASELDIGVATVNRDIARARKDGRVK